MTAYSMHCIPGAMSFSTTVREKLKIPKYEKTDEVKALSLNLSSNHLRQSINYGANEGIDFVLLTNGRVFELYKVLFENIFLTSLQTYREKRG